VAFLLAAVLLVPANALASDSVNDIEEQKTQNDYNNNKIEPDHTDTPNPMQASIDTNLTELNAAHSEITNMMITQNESTLEQYTGPDIPLTMVYIDDDTLVVGLDPAAAYFDVPIEPEYIQFYLDITQPVEIQYVEFQPESHATPDRIKQWQDKYKNACQPVKPGYQKACDTYKRIMVDNLHVPIPTVTAPIPPAPTPLTTSGSSLPCTDNPKSLACYYYKLYEKRCIDGNTHKRCGTYATMIKNAGYDIPADSGSNTPPKPVVIPTYNLDNIRTVQSGNTVTVSWDAPTDHTVKYYKMYVSENGGYAKYKGKLGATATSYTLSGVEQGKDYKFKIKLYHTNTQGSTSTKYFYSDVVSVPKSTPADRTPPVITVPYDITTKTSDKSGKSVRYAVSATDETDGTVSVTCSQASGTVFGIGTTTVTCTASDKATNKTIKAFVVTVTYVETLPKPTVHKFYGGQMIQMSQIATTNPKPHTDNSTITIGVTNTTGTVGLVTAGHSLEIEDNATLDGYYIGENLIKLAADTVAVVWNSKADVGFVSVTETNVLVSQDQLLNKTDGSFVTVKHGSTKTVPLDTDIAIFGIHNNGIGQLKFKNATIYDSNAKISYTNMGIGTYPSQTGDGGASIVTNHAGTNELIGVHGGYTCSFTE
jgi:hypothetical protein